MSASYDAIYKILDNQNFIKDSQVIYHYTSLEALYKILSSGTLHLSHCSYMNDFTEFECGVNYFQSMLKELAETEHDKKLIDIFDIIKNQKDKSNIFIGSFTTLKDSLSQWRAYSPATSNIAIGFNTEKVKQYCAKKMIAFGAVKYTNDFETVFKSYFKELQPALEYAEKHQTQENIKNMNMVIFMYIYMIALFIKHEGFKEEEEIRIVAGNDFKIQYKYNNGIYLPYIEFNFGNSLSDFIDEVWVGPSVNQKLTQKSLKLMLKNHNITDKCKIEVSPIPFRLLS